MVPAAPAASRAVINFEDLAPTAPGYGGHGLPVNTQYNGQGVTFNNPEAFDFSKPTAIPNHAHSGTVAVEPCVAIEFCTAPVAATFTTAQQHVKAWVGFSSALGAPYDVRLTAYNASNTVVGTANATLPARTSPTPIQTPLTVDVASPTITKIEVGPVPGGFANGLDVDDVEFSTAGPAAAVYGDRPADGHRLEARRWADGSEQHLPAPGSHRRSQAPR